MAMIGVTCKMTANGRNARSSHRHCANRIAMNTPPKVAATRPSSVIDNVTQRAGTNIARSAISVVPTRLGAGRT